MNENISPKLMHFNTWSLVGGGVWEGHGRYLGDGTFWGEAPTHFL